MLINGSDLNEAQRKLVLDAFVHRWTFERQVQLGACPACLQHRQHYDVPWHEYHVPLVSDEQWLKEHAFHFTRDGTRLMGNRRYAEPAYLANLSERSSS